MPYNTRRKSLSLPSLGIHLPSTSRSRRSPSTSKLTASTEETQPPTKKVKRSHDSEPSLREFSSALSSRPASKGKDLVRPKGTRKIIEQTPPPSPADVVVAPKIDTEGIKDDVVVAVIEQLEKTGNRPHLGRELAAVLSVAMESVASSANPTALISSRLSAYLKRPWTALAPCPIVKELVPVHPRKVFYFLTTYPRQPFPENVDEILSPDWDGKRVVTPSISNASVDQDEEDADARDRLRLSPSPEIDLSSLEYEDDQTVLNVRGSGSSGAPVSGLTSHRQHRLVHNHRAASPPLEGDEKEFTQTASSVRERASEGKVSRQGFAGDTSPLPVGDEDSKDDSVAFNSTAIDVDSIAETRHDGDQYEDYFSYHGTNDKEQVLDEAAAATLFGTSPSPSLSSVSTLSSGTTVASEAGLTSEDGLIVLKQEIASTLRGVSPVSVVDDAPTTDPHKHTISVAETDLLKESFLLNEHEVRGLKPLDTSVDSEMQWWGDLRSPENVDIDELDAMFADI